MKEYLVPVLATRGSEASLRFRLLNGESGLERDGEVLVTSLRELLSIPLLELGRCRPKSITSSCPVPLRGSGGRDDRDAAVRSLWPPIDASAVLGRTRVSASSASTVSIEDTFEISAQGVTDRELF